jgi:hypothetical protein
LDFDRVKFKKRSQTQIQTTFISGITTVPILNGPNLSFRDGRNGRLEPLELDTVEIPDMNETLLSVFQICNGESMNFQCIAVFTTEGCRIFTLDSVRDALVTMHDTGTEIMRGLWHHGL